jgi:hypothetical protein
VAAAALLATGAAVVAAPAASAAPVTVTGGTIDWGVKASFRSYITSPIAAGTITMGSPATQAAGNGIFTFPVTGGAYDPADGTAPDADGDGSVHFSGHDGLLDVLISDVRVDLSGAGAFVVADVTSKEFIDTTTEGPSHTYDDVQLAQLDLTSITPTTGAGTVSYADVPTALTAAGEPAFGGFYTAGTAFDPISFTLNLDDGEPEPPAQPDGLTWKVSEYAFTSGSLVQARVADAPAVLDTDGTGEDGWRFPVTTASYDPSTGVGDVQYGGAITLGNTSQGNFRIKLADPHLVLNGDGTGSLEADPSYCVGATACAGTWTAGTDVTIVTFPVGTGDISDAGDHVSATFTPDYTGDQFDPEFVTFLPTSLQAFFKASGSGSDGLKPPSPMHVEFDYTPTAPTGVSDSVDISTTVAPGGLTISVADGTVVLPTPTLASSGDVLETSGALGAVTVTDTRATAPGWNVTAQVTDFTGTAGTVDGDGLGWTPHVTSTSNGQTVTAGGAVAPGQGLGGAQLATSPSGASLGTATLDADLDLELPTNTAPGTYTATLTLTAI